ncbi:hypothetical protein NL523_27335, partial [Klebsiella pneumoniae]|nr:hypothetical protein [Klebsiella pneumoniae]MCP6663465.1 hypothetical protein [Klebsiella pneumoniae]
GGYEALADCFSIHAELEAFSRFNVDCQDVWIETGCCVVISSDVFMIEDIDDWPFEHHVDSRELIG